MADTYKTSQDFLQKMDAGELDGNLQVELKNLTVRQLDEVAQLLMARDDEKRKAEIARNSVES